jgi:hypothetical protein
MKTLEALHDWRLYRRWAKANPYYWERKKNAPKYAGYVIACIVLAALMLVVAVCGAEEYSNDQIADAIYKAENSKAHPYGILAHYKHTTPRQACLNTIAHARRDFKGGDFLSFLAGRYCPVGASNDPTGLNKNWLRNVKYFLGRG